MLLIHANCLKRLHGVLRLAWYLTAQCAVCSVWYWIHAVCNSGSLYRVCDSWMISASNITFIMFYSCLQCFLPSVLWHCWLGGRTGIRPVQKWGDDGGGHWFVRMEWRPARLSVCLPLLIFPCTIKSRSFVLAPAKPGGPGKRAVKRLWCGVVICCSWSLGVVTYGVEWSLTVY